MKIYQPKDYKGHNLITENELIKKNLDKVDQSFDPDSQHPQSGTAVAEAIKPKAEQLDLDLHTSNSDIHVKPTDKETWNQKVSTEQLDIVKSDLENAVQNNLVQLDVTKTELEKEIQENADAIDKAKDELQKEIKKNVENALHYRGQVETADLLPEGAEVGDFYNVKNTGANYAWDGQHWDKLSEDLTDLVANVADLQENVADLTDNLTSLTGEVTDLTSKSGELDNRVQALEDEPRIIVDQTFTPDSENPQSGKAIQEVIAPLAVQTDLTKHVSDKTIHILENEKYSILKTQKNLTKDSPASYKFIAFTSYFSGELKSAKFTCRPTGFAAATVYLQLYKATSQNQYGVITAAEYIATSSNSQVLGENKEIAFEFEAAQFIVDGEMYLMQFVGENETSLRTISSSLAMPLVYFSTLSNPKLTQLEVYPKFYSSAELFTVNRGVTYFPAYEFTFSSPAVFSGTGKTKLNNYDLWYKNQQEVIENKLNTHIADTFRHTTKDQLTEGVSDPDIITITSVTGEQDKTFNFVDINENLPYKRLKSIEIKAQQDGGSSTASTIPCYLSIFELTEDNRAFTYMGTSDNAVTQGVRKNGIWTFNNSHIDLSGRRIRLYLTSTDASPYNPQLKFAASCGQASAQGSLIVTGNTGQQFLPEIIWTIDRRKEKFAPIAHTFNSSIHVQEGEREKWDQIENIVTKVNTIESSYQTAENVAELMQTTEIVKPGIIPVPVAKPDTIMTCKFLLHNMYFVPGRLREVTILGSPTNTFDQSRDLYLHIFTSTQPSGGTWAYKGHSINQTHTVQNTKATWYFSAKQNLTIEEGEHVLFIYTIDEQKPSTDHWDAGVYFRRLIGMSTTNKLDRDNISCVYVNENNEFHAHYIPQFELTTEKHTTLPEHCFDEDLHTSLEEKAKWNQIDTAVSDIASLTSTIDTINSEYQTQADVEALVPQVEIIKAMSLSVPTDGKSNAETCRLIMNSKYAVPGRLKEFRMLGRADNKADGRADFYLHIYTSEHGQLSGEWNYLGHSANITHTTNGQIATWLFNSEMEIEKNRHLLLIFTHSEEEPGSSFWTTEANSAGYVGMNGVHRTDDDTISQMSSSATNKIDYVPCVEIITEKHTYLPDHCFDEAIHTTQEERDNLTSEIELLKQRLTAIEEQLGINQAG